MMYRVHRQQSVRGSTAAATCLATYLAAFVATACGTAAPPSDADTVAGALADAAGLPAAVTSATCDGSPTLAVPVDPSLRGPWAVGARTVELPGATTATTLRAEIWYPAAPASAKGAAAVQYDLRAHLSAQDAAKLSDADNPLQTCDCYRDLPVDKDHGPYPLVLFLHGTAGFRTQSLSLMTHWASRGFVVVAADHPGLELKAILALQFAFDQAEEAASLLDTLRTAPPPFLAGVLDTQRIAVSGHSAGGNSLQALGKTAGVQLLLPLAAGGSEGGTAVWTVALGGVADQVVAYAKTVEGFAPTPAPKLLIGIDKAGHLAFSDLCLIAADRGGLLGVAQAAGIQVLPLVAKLAQDGCGIANLETPRGLQVIAAATSAALEARLRCNGGMTAQLLGLQQRFAEIIDLRSEGIGP
jgi:fermentation-respiration switch protein FrsA (DUF1100 family)